MGAEYGQTGGRHGIQYILQPGFLVFTEAGFIIGLSLQAYVVHQDKLHAGQHETGVRRMNHPGVAGHVARLACAFIDIPVVIAGHAGPTVRQGVQRSAGRGQKLRLVVHQVSQKDG